MLRFIYVRHLFHKHVLSIEVQSHLSKAKKKRKKRKECYNFYIKNTNHFLQGSTVMVHTCSSFLILMVALRGHIRIEVTYSPRSLPWLKLWVVIIHNAKRVYRYIWIFLVQATSKTRWTHYLFNQIFLIDWDLGL